MATMAAAKSRNRSRNFESSEIQLIADLVEKNISVLNSKLTNTITNERKKTLWERITNEINALGICQRTTKEMKTKWMNMHQCAKREYSEQKINMRKTGGGKFSQPLSTTSEKIVDIYKECPSFTGLTGIESSLQLSAEQNIEIVGSPKTLDLLAKVLQESEGAVPSIEPNEPSTSSAQICSGDILQTDNTESTSAQSRISVPRKIKPMKRKIKAEDVTQLQYEVLLEQKKKLMEQTTYYQLMNKKLIFELQNSAEANS